MTTFEERRAAVKAEFEKQAKQHGQGLTREQQRIVEVTALKINQEEVRKNIAELSARIAEANKAIEEQEEISAILGEMIEETKNENA